MVKGTKKDLIDALNQAATIEDPAEEEQQDLVAEEEASKDIPEEVMEEEEADAGSVVAETPDYSRMTKKALEDICLEKNIPAKGTKKDLVSRILKHSEVEVVNDEPVPATETEEQTPNDEAEAEINKGDSEPAGELAENDATDETGTIDDPATGDASEEEACTDAPDETIDSAEETVTDSSNEPEVTDTADKTDVLGEASEVEEVTIVEEVITID